jgi:hypothetical protein
MRLFAAILCTAVHVCGFAASPLAVVPAAGSSAAQTFTFTFLDSPGWQTLTIVNVLINDVLDARQACYVAFLPADANSGELLLVNDAGDAGGPFSSTMLPGSGAVQNSQCSISATGSSVSASGNALTLTLAISFAPRFAGDKVIYLAARDTASNSGWQALGTWTVAGAIPGGPYVKGLAPARSMAASQTYTFSFADTSGWQDISIANVLINGAIDAKSACYVAFTPATPASGTLYLVDDAGDAGGPFATLQLPGSGTVSNGQCTISAAGSSVSAAGDTLALTLAIAFSNTFAGNRVLYLASRSGLRTSNWHSMGSLTAGVAGAWPGYGRDAQHSATAGIISQHLNRIRWQTPVDLQPQYSDTELLIHYGSPLATAQNTILVPVKTGVDGGFRVEARRVINGGLIWSLDSDYVLPPHDWTPPFQPVLTATSRLYYPGAGGTVYYRDDPDALTGATGQIAFYGIGNYRANSQAYNASVMISTPITADPAGNIYFGFLVNGDTPLGLRSGIARITAGGQGMWIAAAAAASDNSITQVVGNCAPALNWNLGTLYIAVSNGATGYLLALDVATLKPVARVRLAEPAAGGDAILSDNGTAAPTVGLDGDVYFGVQDAGENDLRGWLLHFDSALAHPKTPGAFGWDDTASLVPSWMVPLYTGTSPYLLMTKYNDYVEGGGKGLNRIAILDPNATQNDPITGLQVMREVATALGTTPAGDQPGVKEWCINSAAVDPATKSIFAGNEDGKLYRWDLVTNALAETVVLSSGLGEAYTPTLIGPDGTVYAINNATLFAVGQ